MEKPMEILDRRLQRMEYRMTIMEDRLSHPKRYKPKLSVMERLRLIGVDQDAVQWAYIVAIVLAALIENVGRKE